VGILPGRKMRAPRSHGTSIGLGSEGLSERALNCKEFRSSRSLYRPLNASFCSGLVDVIRRVDLHTLKTHTLKTHVVVLYGGPAAVFLLVGLAFGAMRRASPSE
jgi:hypothetical protein